MTIVLGQFEVHPDDIPSVTAIMDTMARETRKEKGCILYDFAVDITNPNRICLSELWTDPEALAEHFETPHMAVFRAAIADIRVLSRSVKVYEGQFVKDL